jgi:2-polyprenyl-3-methyl-5-hydroxy-6-metoxy-1,4-benzoquinol methylase
LTTTFVSVNCPACGSSHSVTRHAAVPLRDAHDDVCGTTDIVECQKCGAGYLKQRLSDDALDAFYQSDMLSNWFENDYRRIANRHRKQLAQYVSILSRFRGSRLNQRALDFGCGGGGAAATMNELGYSVVAYDTSAVSRKIALELNAVRAVDSIAGVGPGSFDAITLLDVIEHVPNPAGLVDYLSTLMAPGGHILVATPNYNSILRRLRGVKWSGYDTRAHLVYFTENSLHKIVEHAGLRVRYSRTWGFMSEWLPLPGGQALTLVAEKN